MRRLKRKADAPGPATGNSCCAAARISTGSLITIDQLENELTVY